MRIRSDVSKCDANCTRCKETFKELNENPMPKLHNGGLIISKKQMLNPKLQLAIYKLKYEHCPNNCLHWSNI